MISPNDAESGLFLVEMIEPGGCNSLKDKQLNTVSRWLCFAHFRSLLGLGCILIGRCGMLSAALRPVKIAIVMLTGRFRRPRATITSERMLFVEQTPLGPRHPKSLSKLSKIIRGFPTSSFYDRTGRLLRASPESASLGMASTRSFSVLANECVGLGRAAGGPCRWRSWLGEELVEPFRGRGLGSLLDLRFELPALGFPFLGRQVLERTTLEFGSGVGLDPERQDSGISLDRIQRPDPRRVVV